MTRKYEVIAKLKAKNELGETEYNDVVLFTVTNNRLVAEGLCDVMTDKVGGKCIDGVFVRAAYSVQDEE